MFGCDGGWTDRALNYLQGAGAMSQVSYPYTADENFRCKYDSSKVIARVSSVVTITDPLSAIKEGPIGVYVQALGPFLSYQSGIFNGACSKTSYDHAVTAVGFGNENGVNYWILRDSLGSTFGEDGHIRVQANGNCYITFVAAPIVA
jgi:cathepsin H